MCKSKRGANGEHGKKNKESKESFLSPAQRRTQVSRWDEERDVGRGQIERAFKSHESTRISSEWPWEWF